jgi:transposase
MGQNAAFRLRLPMLAVTIGGAMFVRVKLVRSGGRTYRYVQLVENRRVNGRVRQRVLGNLGQLESLQESGNLERVVRQLIAQCPSMRIMSAQAKGGLEVEDDREWGPVLVFDRVWEELGLKALLRRLVAQRKLEFDFERMVFAQTLQRLVAPGSDLAGSKWIGTIHEPTFGKLRLQHFYRSLGLLWKQKAKIEEALFRRGLDLFNQELDLVFFDTTSTYFEGVSLKGWAELGKSKDHRPDHLQLVISVVMRRDGFPVSCEIWPGNTADMTTLQPTIEALRKRFRIRKVVLVCDRGMVSEENLRAMEDAGYEYIVGVKMRKVVEVRDEVLGRAGRYQEVSENLQVKEVWVDHRRYVICFNPEEAIKDAADREHLIEQLRKRLRTGNPKALLNNRGYRRFVKVAERSATIDEARIEEEIRYDGKYVLRTTTSLPADEVAQAYKQLTWIERLWRELKDVVQVRPVYHHWERDNVKGHIFVCFLALYLAAQLKRKLADAKLTLPWDEVIRDLSQVRAVTLRANNDRFLMRSPLKGSASTVFAAVGVKPPNPAEAL